jgi:hypothetical protein
MINKIDANVLEKYLNTIVEDKFHRYRSWDNCFRSFNSSIQTEIQIIELAFYLASWGMYRGSSGLLQKNHLIHKGAIDILFSKTYQNLKCNPNNEVMREDISDILYLKDELAKYYSSIYFIKGAAKPKPIAATDTLLSKILLGTFACVPAYDRYFIDGLQEMKMEHTGFSEVSLNELFNFIDYNDSEIIHAQKLIFSKNQNHYPRMKILDMYFWQIGYDKDLKAKKRKTSNGF